MRYLAAVVVAAFLVALAPFQSSSATTSCTPTLKGAPARSSAHAFRHADVWLYGDSLTYQTYKDLRAHVARVAVDAWWGRNTASAVTALGSDVHRFAGRLPDVVVIATGTNDLTNPDGFAHQVALARAVLPRSVRLVWVNVYADTTPAYNTADRILDAAEGVHMLSWSGANLSRYTGDRSPLLVDGVHVNGWGCTVRNRLIEKAL